MSSQIEKVENVRSGRRKCMLIPNPVVHCLVFFVDDIRRIGIAETCWPDHKQRSSPGLTASSGERTLKVNSQINIRDEKQALT